MEAARTMGATIAAHGLTTVYGGASVGLMGALADGALSNNGKVIGILPTSLQEKEIGHAGLTELHIVDSMHERKAMMADLSDGFIAMPGGIGTLEELFEVWTWGQLGYHSKPVGTLNIGGFYDQLMGFIDQQVSEGFMRSSHREMLLSSDEPDDLLEQMAAYEAPSVVKWVDRQDT